MDEGDCTRTDIPVILMTIMDDRTDAADPDLAERIRHALAYPFARPACSYLFADGRMQPLPKRNATLERVPVVASGSNAAPDRLVAKFGADSDAIPVMRAVLHDFAVVFAGHFTRYGAIPATLTPSSGARTQVWITWLTPEQLTVMHRSEGVIGCLEVEQRYDFALLDGLDLRPEGMPRVQRAGAYLSKRMLAPEGHPIRFAEVFSRECSLKAWNQRSALRLVHRRLAPEVTFAMFMARILSHADQRQALFRELTPHTVMRG